MRDIYYETLKTRFARHNWLLNLAKSATPKRRRLVNAGDRKRKRTILYFLPRVGLQTRVCAQFISETLHIGKSEIRHIFETAVNPRSSRTLAKRDARGGDRRGCEKGEDVAAFISKLPLLMGPDSTGPDSTGPDSTGPDSTGHDSTRKLLPAEFRNLTHLYRKYYLKGANKGASFALFRKVWKKEFSMIGFISQKPMCSRKSK